MNRKQKSKGSSVALSVKGITVKIGERNIVNNVSFELNDNEVIGLFGFSGSGKSTLLKAIAGLHENNSISCSGVVSLHGDNVWSDDYKANLINASRIVYLDQNPVVFPCNIYENILIPVRYYIRSWDFDEIVESSLKKAGIWDEVKDKLSEEASSLSVGQRQRLCLARALAIEPELLLLDEPTAHLDQFSMEKVEETILTLKNNISRSIFYGKNYISMIVVTHNVSQVIRISDNFLFMKEGQIVENGPIDQLYDPEQKITQDYVRGIIG